MPLGVDRMTMSASVPLLCPTEGLGVDIADPDQLRPLGVLLEGIEVVGRDPPASGQGEPDPAVTNERLGNEHVGGKGNAGRATGAMT
jgi:hypothetical protein